MKPRGVLWIIIILVFLAVLVDIPYYGKISIPKTKISFSLPSVNFPIKFGLDLQGGTELVLHTDMSKIAPSDRDNALQSARDVIERRVNAFGVSEAQVVTATTNGDRRILVDLPGVSDASQAAKLVGKTAQLDFREEPATLSAQEIEATKSGVPSIYFFKDTGLTGADLTKAQVTFNGTQSNLNAGSPQVALQFNDVGAKKFADITKRNVGKPLCIFLDNQLLAQSGCPTVSGEIDGGSAVINGQFSTDQANQLAIDLNAGALPVPVTILSQDSISPTLGQESVSKSLIAGIIGLTIVIFYMALYYGWIGLVADSALIIYTLFVFAIFKTGLFLIPPITLTAAGIAGFVLSIGMAVDANILIFERMKEERRWGRDKKKALELGFGRAWSSIRDSNISSLITASILYYFGTSLIQGFAITLGIGVLVSMFTAVVVSRTFLRTVT